MIIQEFHIKECDWDVSVIYNATQDDVDRVSMFLENKDMDEESLKEASMLFRECILNSGMTYSDVEKRMSLMVIGYGSCASEFADTLDHEKGHLMMHLAQYCNIEVFSERFQYLNGNIGNTMFPYASIFLCDKCYRYK